MAVNKMMYTGANSDNGPSPILWHNCPISNIIEDPNVGYLVDDDFCIGPVGYTVTQATSGTFSAGDGVGGFAVADTGGTIAGQGPNIQGAAAFLPASGKHVWFECRVKLTASSTEPDIFIGLSETDTTIISGGANSSANHIGWHSFTNDNVALFSSEKAGAGATRTGHTFVDGTFVKLGFFYDGNADTVKQYVDGVSVGTDTATANIPKVALAISCAIHTNGTTRPTAVFDWWRCAQLR